MTDDNPFRQFYEQGGRVDGDEPKRRLNKRLLLALWGSQNMATGGTVPANKKPGDSLNRIVEAMTALHRACGGRV